MIACNDTRAAATAGFDAHRPRGGRAVARRARVHPAHRRGWGEAHRAAGGKAKHVAAADEATTQVLRTRADLTSRCGRLTVAFLQPAPPIKLTNRETDADLSFEEQDEQQAGPSSIGHWLKRHFRWRQIAA
jgi:hypothetical protein